MPSPLEKAMQTYYLLESLEAEEQCVTSTTSLISAIKDSMIHVEDEISPYLQALEKCEDVFSMHITAFRIPSTELSALPLVLPITAVSQLLQLRAAAVNAQYSFLIS